MEAKLRYILIQSQTSQSQVLIFLKILGKFSTYCKDLVTWIPLLFCFNNPISALMHVEHTCAGKGRNPRQLRSDRRTIYRPTTALAVSIRHLLCGHRHGPPLLPFHRHQGSRGLGPLPPSRLGRRLKRLREPPVVWRATRVLVRTTRGRRLTGTPPQTR